MFVESYMHFYAKEVLKKWLESNILESNKKEFEFEYSENEYNNNLIELEYPIYKKGTMDSTKYNWSMLIGDGITHQNTI